MRHVFLMALTFGVALATSPARGASGEDEAYMVRYLVFQHQGYWDDALLASGPRKDKAQRISRRAELPDSIADEGPMDKIWKRLSGSEDYRPLLQGLAAVDAVPKKKADPLPVREAWTASIRTPFTALDEIAKRPMRIVRGGEWGTPGLDRNWDADRLQGSLTFYKGRYAHLRVNLVFSEQKRWMPWGIDTRHHFLVQSRRLLPNRYYYFDHSRFGVIARIESLE